MEAAAQLAMIPVRRRVHANHLRLITQDETSHLDTETPRLAAVKSRARNEWAPKLAAHIGYGVV